MKIGESLILGERIIKSWTAKGKAHVLREKIIIGRKLRETDPSPYEVFYRQTETVTDRSGIETKEPTVEIRGAFFKRLRTAEKHAAIKMREKNYPVEKNHSGPLDWLFRGG